jgi:hypothetical protein
MCYDNREEFFKRERFVLSKGSLPSKEQMGHGIINIIYQLSPSLTTAKKTDFYSGNIRFKPKGLTLFINFKGSLV